MKNKKFILATSAGHILEYFDAKLYGLFAVMLAPLFFPETNAAVSIIASFGVFAAGFVMRPFGAILFGHLGDRLGRKKAFIFSIITIIVPTFGIGCLPTYDSIGIAAPILLVTFRLVQGISLGGEFGGASIFIREHIDKKQAAFAGSILVALGAVGGILGGVLGAIFTKSGMPPWAWRVPFLLGGLLGIIVYIMRRNLVETPTFEKIKREGNLKKIPIVSVVKNNFKGILRGIGIGINTTIPFYLAIIYMNAPLKSKFDLSISESMVLNTGIMVLCTFLLPFAGKLADKVGKLKLMAYSSLLTAFIAYPAYMCLLETTSLSIFYSTQILIILTSIPYMGTCASVLPMLFSPSERYSGSAFSYAFGCAFFGGTAPLISAYLTNSGMIMGPAYYLIVSGIIGFIAVSKLKLFEDIQEKRHENIITFKQAA